MRAVIYGDLEHFDPVASPVVNVFDISMPEGREHFLLGNVLAFVQRRGDMGGKDGFVAATDVYDFCQGLGFMPTQIEFALHRARQKKLLDTSPRYSEGSEMVYRITTPGAYTYAELPKYFSYVDAIIVDTPIVDPSYRAKIGNSQLIGERVERMELFHAYLNEQYKPLSGKPIAFDWPIASYALRVEIKRVRETEERKESSRKVRNRDRYF